MYCILLNAQQVTNQMVKACKAYISDKGLTKIWDLSRDIMVDRLANCVYLYKHYRESFYRIKRKIDQSPEELIAGLSQAGLPNIYLPNADSFLQVDEIPMLGSGKLDLKGLSEVAHANFGE